MVYGNNALDYRELEQFKTEKSVARKPKPRVRTNIAFIKLCNTLMIAIIAFCAFVILSGYVDATVMTQEISSQQTKLDELRSQEVSLNAKLNNLFNLEFVEQYATENLNMVKLDTNQIEQVYIQNDDKVELNGKPKLAQIVFDNLTRVCYNLLEYIS